MLVYPRANINKTCHYEVKGTEVPLIHASSHHPGLLDGKAFRAVFLTLLLLNFSWVTIRLL